MTFATGQLNKETCGAPAFTLVELILVMAILCIVIAVAAPSMSGFFHGRTQGYEARRFVSLARFGQNRAVSEGVPVQLWIDEKERTYGLELVPGYTDEDRKAETFELDKNLTIKVEEIAGSITRGKLPTIRFEPDGSIAGDGPVQISINEDKSKPILIVLKDSGLSYEIQNQDKAVDNAFH